MGELVEADEVEAAALVLEAVLGVLHGAEGHLGAGGEDPGALGLEEAGAGEGGGVELAGAVDELGELGVGLAEEDGAVVGDMDLPQGLGEEGVGLAAAGGAAVEGLVLGALLEEALPGAGASRGRVRAA